MMRACLCVAALVAVFLMARDDKAELPDDLARVSAKSDLVVSVRVSKLWEGELAKAIRAVRSDFFAWQVRAFREQDDLSPGEVERATLALNAAGPDGRGDLQMVVAAKKLDPKTVLPTILPRGT
jgi:hypothetical protein